MLAVEFLKRRADEYRALGEEHAEGAERMPYLLVELTLRAVADALEKAAEFEEAA